MKKWWRELLCGLMGHDYKWDTDRLMSEDNWSQPVIVQGECQSCGRQREVVAAPLPQ